MDTKEILTIVGWPVTFVLGIGSGLIIPKLSRKRQILTWAVISEVDLVPRELSKTLGLPVTLQVGEVKPTSLSALTLRVGNSGNEVINNLTFAVSLNEGTSTLNVRFVGTPGEYASHVRWTIADGKCKVSVDFINPDQSFELEILVSEYEREAVEIDASAPGVEVRKTNAIRWNAAFVRGVGLSIPIIGLRYDSGAVAMAEVAEEIKALRRFLAK